MVYRARIQRDCCCHVSVVNGLRHQVQQVFLQKIKALAWLRILTLMLVHVHLEQQLMNYFILHLLSNQVEEVMAVARQLLKIEYYTNVDDFFNTIKK
ncbi:hypothetical protein HmCmsJML242_00222 [Escherichia coli]|nr:hypothetical protein HmCmsJML242_00222 [Escherichia coli]